MNSTPTMLQAAPSGGLLTPPNSGGPGPMMGNSLSAADLAAKKAQEREALRQVIQQWNANRLDLFELSEPNEDLEFHGVMRFYFQDSGQKVATKCIRVASTASTQAVIETLIEKFRPDMRMLSVPEYALYEIHENGDERRLGVEQRPLLVQLNWHRDDREGRFLLRRIDDKTNFATFGAHGVRPDGLLQVPTTVSSFQEDNSFKRKLSKREKKQLKKQEKLNKIKSVTPAPGQENDSSVAEKLYTELPETSFTRSISNPEAVMRRRRQQKLERKLQQFRSKDGGPDTGGTLKIYGEALCRDVPYKTLLLSVSDTAHAVVKEMLSKYGLEREDPLSYCLVQVNVAPTGESKEYHGNNTNREYILDDDECPLAILMNHPSSRVRGGRGGGYFLSSQLPRGIRGSIMFHVRRRPADYHPRKRKKKPSHKGRPNELLDYRYEDAYERLPYLLELNPDGSDINGAPKKHRLQLDVTEVGGDRPPSAGGGGGGSSGSGSGSQTLQLFGPNIQPRHCVIANTGGIVTVTPCSRDAETYVNGVRIYETTILQHGAVVKFGRIHNFRFLDPLYDERTRQRHDSSSRHEFSYDRQQAEHDTSSLGPPSSHPPPSQNYETTFDVDGHVETISTASLKEDARSQRSISSSRDGNNRPPSTYERYPRGQDPILPAVLEFREETRDALFDALIPSLEPAAVHFKLAPTYALYLAARYRASTHFRPDLTPTERAHRLSTLLERLAAMIQAVIQERYSEAESLAFWMANASELLHFLKSDRHISAFSLDAQDILAETVQMAFRNLVECLQTELAQVMPVFLAEDRDEAGDDEPATAVLAVLAGAMALLRRCRVNAALTIQLFSQLFHFVNMWAFNRMVCGDARLCTRQWGLRLKARLGHIEEWAEKQGLELAADCHLSRIVQAAHLLQAPKYNADDLATLSSTCFKLNSLQLRALLHRYQPATDEPRLPHELIDNVVRVAESVADELARSDGREVRLEEDVELALPFLLPEDGYSCDVVRGMPVGLSELLAPLQNAGLCRVTPQPTSSGLWTIYMTDHSQHGPRSPSAMSNRSGALVGPHQEPEVQVIKLHKSNNGMGLSIVAAKLLGVVHESAMLYTDQHGRRYLVAPHQVPLHGPDVQHARAQGRLDAVVQHPCQGNGRPVPGPQTRPSRRPAPMPNGAGQERLGIYIKSVVKGGAADADGRLQAGDQLLKVDGQSLVGITQEKAAEYLVRTGPVVTLEVAKQGAIYHGLATLLSQPSPVMGRAPQQQRQPQSELYPEVTHMAAGGLMPPAHSKSMQHLAPARYPPRNILQPQQPPAHHYEWAQPVNITGANLSLPKPEVNDSSSSPPVSSDTNTCSSETSCLYRHPVYHGQVEQDCSLQAEECVETDEDDTKENEETFSSPEKEQNSESSEEHTSLSPMRNVELGQGRVAALAKHFSDLGFSYRQATCLRKGVSAPEMSSLDASAPGFKLVFSVINGTEYKKAISSPHLSQVGSSNNCRRASLDSSKRMLLKQFSSQPFLYNSKGKNKIYSSQPNLSIETTDSIKSILRPYGSQPSLQTIVVQNHDERSHSEENLASIQSEPRGSVHNGIEIPYLELHSSEENLDSITSGDKGSGPSSLEHCNLLDIIRDPANRITEEPVSIELEYEEKPVNGFHEEHFNGFHKNEDLNLFQKNNELNEDFNGFHEEEELNGFHEEHAVEELNGFRKKEEMNGFQRPRSFSSQAALCAVDKLRLSESAERNSRPYNLLQLLRSPSQLSVLRKAGKRGGHGSVDCLLLMAKHLDHSPRPSSAASSSSHKHGRPRRMSERDLPNRVLTEQNHNTVEPRRSLPPPHMPSMQSSKSVPALNSNNGEVHPAQPASAAKPSHEVFNPGYSRTSSTNSIPQKAFDAAHQSPNAGGIRSRSSHNLHDNTHGMPPLPPHAGQAAVSRQASTPILPGQQQQQATPQSQPQQQESERFYQNLSVYRSSAGHPEHPGQVNGYPAAPPSPSRGKMPSPHGDRLMGQQMPPQQQQPQQPTPQQLQQQMNMKTAGSRGSQSSLPRPTDLNMVNAGPIRDRPASAYLPQHGPQHPHGVVPSTSVPRSQSARDMLRQEAKLHEMQEEVRRREARGPPPMNSPNGPYYPPGQHPANLPHSRSHPQLPPQAMQQQQQQQPQMRPSNTFPPGSGYPEGAGSPMHPNGPYPAHHMQMAGYPPRHPGVQVLPSGPPTAPKPRGPRGPYDTVESVPGRPPPPDDMYRESPPPPPPPTSTHPLYQPGKAPQATDNRYAASMGEPPRGAYMPTNTGRPPQQPYGGTNPWDREEREKEQLRRREAARQWRDQQISELEALQGSRTPQQEEQLRALRLEREFQRRAEEAARLGDDDEEEGEESATTPQDENGERPPQGLLMRSSISPEEALRQQQFQQHMARARLVQSPNGDVAPRPQQSPATSDSSAAQYGRQQAEQAPAQYGRQMEERDRQRKLEEMRRKQLELEAAKEAEERILREAQRRREEELRLQREQQMREQQFLMQQQQLQQQQQQQLQQQQLQQQQQQHFHAQQQQQAAQSPAYHSPNPAASPAQRPPHTNHLHPNAAHQYKTASPTTPLRLEGLNNSTAHYNGHPPHTTNGPYSPHDEGLSTPTGTQRLDSLLHSNGAPASPSTPVNAPPPPERGSSFSVMQQQQQQPGGVLRNSSSAPRSEPKRVSFHDPKASPPEVNNHVDRPREDPNNFINEAQTLLATPRSPDGSFTGNTPGVIGAQEVYKDPRMRRLAEQQHQKLLQTRQGPGPEKLSFKEKMKMFAMETGEDGTPKDKVKISRAQRDIEGVAQPHLNNNSLTAATDDRNY